MASSSQGMSSSNQQPICLAGGPRGSFPVGHISAMMASNALTTGPRTLMMGCTEGIPPGDIPAIRRILAKRANKVIVETGWRYLSKLQEGPFPDGSNCHTAGMAPFIEHNHESDDESYDESDDELCRCGKKQAACGACGQGWAQRKCNEQDLRLDPDLGRSESGSQRPPPKRSHQCELCNMWFLASEVLMDQDDPAYSWQGGQPSKKCLPCLREKEKRFLGEKGQKKFNKASTKARESRKRALGEDVRERLRTVTWKRAKTAMVRDVGLTSREYFRKLAMMAKAFAVEVVLGMTKAPPQQQQLYVEAMDRAERNLAKAALDDDAILELRTMFIDESLTQYMSAVIAGIDEYFICRWKECGYVGLNAHWIKMVRRWQFRCPDCINKYKPWAKMDEGKGEHLIKAQKIIVIDPKRREGHPDHGLRALGDLVDINDKINSVSMMLCEWPQTEVCNLINQFKEITGQLYKDVEKMNYRDIEQELIQTAKLMKRSYMTTKSLSPSSRQQINDINKNSSEQWDISAVDEGYQGFNYKYNGTDPILQSKDVMRMWGLAKYYVELNMKASKL